MRLRARVGGIGRILAGCAALLLAGALASGCARHSTPENHKEMYDPAKASKLGRGDLSYHVKTCAPPGHADYLVPAAYPRPRSRHNDLAMRYSPGDRVNIYVYGAPDFTGDYVVNIDGTLVLPYAGPIQAIGLNNVELGARIGAAYVHSGIFRREALKITTRPILYAPINVTVAGAVFLPGRHSINTIKDSDKLDRMLLKFGDSPMERFVPAALRAAGGARPDADLSRVKVTRHGRSFLLDWRGAITGQPVDDMALVEGDHVEVAESGCFQSALVRPSQITPAGIRIFSSNLIQPQNHFQMGNPAQMNNLPYGTRFLQGIVHVNCVGGALASNGRRFAVLISRNPRTKETEVVQRSIEELVKSADRDLLNPFLMPDDAIACYDSAVTDFREIMGTITSVVDPAQGVRNLFRPSN